MSPAGARCAAMRMLVALCVCVLAVHAAPRTWIDYVADTGDGWSVHSSAPTDTC